MARRLREGEDRIAQEKAAETREYYETKEARDARDAQFKQERADEAARAKEANNEAEAKGRRVRDLKKDPSTTPEQLEQAKADAKEANQRADKVKAENAANEKARQEAAQNDPQNWDNKPIEGVYNPETGEVTYGQSAGKTPAEGVVVPKESQAHHSNPGCCGLPHAMEGARQGAPAGQAPPKLQTGNGGSVVRNQGQTVERIPACGNCEAIKSYPENNIENVSPKPSPHGAPGYPAYPGDGNDGTGGAGGADDYYGGDGAGGGGGY